MASTYSMEETQDLPVGRAFAFNSRRLRAVYVKEIAKGIGLPTKAAGDELRQLIEGHLIEEGREPPNVQVIIDEKTRQVYWCIYLVDDSSVFKEIHVCNDEYVEAYNDKTHDEEQEQGERINDRASSEGKSGSSRKESGVTVVALQQHRSVVEAEYEAFVQKKRTRAKETGNWRDRA